MSAPPRDESRGLDFPGEYSTTRTPHTRADRSQPSAASSQRIMRTLLACLLVAHATGLHSPPAVCPRQPIRPVAVRLASWQPTGTRVLRGSTVILNEADGSKEAGSKKKTASAEEWRTLLRLCKPDLPLLVVAFCALSLAATGEALMPALQGAAINSALSIDPGIVAMPGGLRASLLRLAGVGIGTALFTGIRGFIFWLVGARLVQRLRSTLFDALLKQPQAFHDEQGPGELSSRLATDCVKLGDVLSLNVNIVLRQIMQSLVGVSIVLRINRRLACLVLLGVALRAIFSHYYAQVSRIISKAQQDALASSSGVAEQCLPLIKVVRSHGTDASEGERYQRQLDEVSCSRI